MQSIDNQQRAGAPGRLWRLFSSKMLRLGLALGVLGLALFPFGWLGGVWPKFGRRLDRVFATDWDHAIGHSGLFFILGLLALIFFPSLRARPWRYIALLSAVGIGQEAFQLLYKGRLMLFDHGRDLATDLLGIVAALAIVWIWNMTMAELRGDRSPL